MAEATERHNFRPLRERNQATRFTIGKAASLTTKQHARGAASTRTRSSWSPRISSWSWSAGSPDSGCRLRSTTTSARTSRTSRRRRSWGGTGGRCCSAWRPCARYRRPRDPR
eukprot:6611068-Prymnesium_polylepis.1